MNTITSQIHGMHRRINSASIRFTLLLCTLFFGLGYSTNYYVDNSKTTNGSGTQSNPWNTLNSVNNKSGGFSAGDKIFLRRGTGKAYTATRVKRGTLVSITPNEAWGTLTPKGSGTAASPITIDAYGTGNSPRIDAQGQNNTAGILLYDQNYWVIQNLEVSNTIAGVTHAYRWGILVYFQPTTSPTLRSGIKIINNYVHDVYATSYFSGPPNKFYTGGIYVWVAAAGIATYTPSTPANNRIADVSIEGNTVENITGHGIVFRGESIWDYNVSADKLNWNNLSTGVVIKLNLVKNILDGIHWMGTDNALIEYNIVDKAGGTGIRGTNSPYVTEAVAAIWPACSRGGTVQYNEVMNTLMLPKDGYAFDSDLIQDGILLIQYNYSHENEGGFFMDVWPFTDDGSNIPKTIVRYNLSQNDGRGNYPVRKGSTFNLHRGNTEIYNNTIYTTDAIRFIRYNHAEITPNTTNKVYNNIFYGTQSNWEVNDPSEPGGPFLTIPAAYDYNCYYGGLTPPTPAPHRTVDIVKVTSNPMLLNPGSGTSGIASTVCYKLDPTSSCINKGLRISDNGNRDFFGAGLYNNEPEIGAYEVPSIVPILNLLLLD